MLRDTALPVEPERFRPERSTARRPVRLAAVHGGVRRCLGATFASAEMSVVLAEVLRRVELAPSDSPGEAARVRHVTVVPERGAIVTARAHRTAGAVA